MTPSFVAFDTESTDLNGSFGHLLCAAFCDISGDSVDVFRLDSEEYRGINLSDDSKLVKAIKKYMENCFCWISWYGKMHDVPLINTRLAKAGVDPVCKRFHLDIIYYFRKPFLSLHSSKLEEVAKTFKFKNQKTKLDPNTWVAAYELNHDAMNEVSDHCVADALATKEAYLISLPYIRNIHT